MIFLLRVELPALMEHNCRYVQLITPLNFTFQSLKSSSIYIKKDNAPYPELTYSSLIVDYTDCLMNLSKNHFLIAIVVVDLLH